MKKNLSKGITRRPISKITFGSPLQLLSRCAAEARATLDATRVEDGNGVPEQTTLENAEGYILFEEGVQ